MSLPGLTRQSIKALQNESQLLMDARVNPRTTLCN